MIESQKVESTIFRAIDEINRQLEPEKRVEKTRDTALLGGSSKLDSLGLINFIVTVEQKVEEEFGIAITLASDEAVFQKNSKLLNSVGTLADYISKCLGKKSNE